MSKILLTGASGLLGLNLALAVAKEHQVYGVANTVPLSGMGFSNIQAELTEPGVVDSLLEQIAPDVVIHCAAMANVDDCESKPELAEKVNAYLPGQIALAAAARQIKMVHISTDAVFDGRKGNYAETDGPNPLSVYARTKLAGEKAVLAANAQALVARVNFYGWSVSGGRSLAEWFVNNLANNCPMQGFTDLFFCPMMVLDLVDTLLEAVAKDLMGLYHVVGPQAMSKYDFGCAIAHRFGYDSELIRPASVQEGGLKAARSPDLTLNTHKLVTSLGHPLPGFTAGLQKFYDQYLAGYPQFLKSLA